MAHDLDAVAHDHFARDRALDIAALLDGQVDDHAARLHRRDLRITDQARRRPAGDQRGGDDDVLLGNVRRDQLGLGRLIFVGHFRGIATGAFALDAGHLLHEDRLGAERFDLLLGRGAHVGRTHLRTQPPRGGDRLKTGHAHAHDEAFGRRHGARRRHHHREGTVIFSRRVQHRLVSRQVRLGRQDVHRLRASDARHELHRQRLIAGRSIGIDPCPLAERVEARDDPGSRRSAAKAGRIGALHAQQDIGARQRRGTIANAGTGGGISVVSNRRRRASAGLDSHACAQRDEFLHGLGRTGHAPFARSLFLQYRNFHYISIPLL